MERKRFFSLSDRTESRRDRTTVRERTSESGPSPSDVNRVLNSLGACELRSAFAQALFASQRCNFRRESDFCKTVGSWVASDIQHNVELRMKMLSLGYKPRQRGYTLRQRQVLVEFYMRKLPLASPGESEKI